MKSLRSYMNDLEEDAAMRSATEEQQRTAIDAHNADIALVMAQAKEASEEAEWLATTMAQVGIEMAEKQGRIAVLDVECATLKQTLVLFHQKIASTSVQLNEKRLFCRKIMGALIVKLQEQQEWLSNKIITMESPVATSLSKKSFIEGELHVISFRRTKRERKKCRLLKQITRTGEKHGMFNSEGSLDKFESGFAKKHEELNTQLELAKPKLQDIKSKGSALLLETSKVKQILKQDKNILAGFPAALQQTDMTTLDEEYKALQGDKAGEIEYFHSLEEMVNRIKGVLDPVKCRCGLEYKVELGSEAMDRS